MEKGEVRGQAVRFYVAVLNQLFERERKKVPFDPVRDYALLEESEMKYTRIRDEYERFLRCVTEEGVYAFMRLSKRCTPYQTLGHIAGVHHVAMYMARQLIHTGIPVDLGLMSGAALMHDIGKFGCRPVREDVFLICIIIIRISTASGKSSKLSEKLLPTIRFGIWSWKICL